MKDTILAAKEYLSTTFVTDLFDGANVFLSIDETIIPRGLDFSGALAAIGIKDGDADYLNEELENTDTTFEIDYIVYYLVSSDDAAFEGSSTEAADGILGLTKTLRLELKDNLFGLENLETALPARERASALLVLDDITLLMKVLTMRYTKLEDDAE